MQKKHAWLLVFVLLGTLYYLSSIPGLRVLPVLQQLNNLFGLLDVSFEKAAIFISSNLPGELGPVQTFSSDFYEYASENPIIIEFILRKIAHVVVFFIITIAIFLLLREYTTSKLLAVGGAFLFAIIIAILDEYHQSFVDGRHGNIVDVLIDMIGIILATSQILFSFFLTGSWQRRNKTPWEK